MKPGIEQVQALVDISGSGYVVVAMKLTHRLQIAQQCTTRGFPYHERQNHVICINNHVNALSFSCCNEFIYIQNFPVRPETFGTTLVQRENHLIAIIQINPC